MAGESIAESGLVTALRDLVADVRDLLQKEMRLAKAEIGEKVSGFAQAGIWMAAAGLLGLMALFLLLQAIVFGIAAFGLAMHWSCLIVAVAVAAIAAGLFFYGRSLARGSLSPERTMNQISQDLRTIRSS
jgi:hypothetical protein